MPENIKSFKLGVIVVRDLTLLICNHNHGHFLKRMLRDVFNQTLNPDRWKLIIIHDECSDGSEEIFDEVWTELCSASGRPVDWLPCFSFVKEKKKGLANCKNFGLSRCDTKYVAYLDVDDGMLPERLATQLGFLENNPEIDAVFTQAWDLNDKGQLLVNCFGINTYITHNDIAAALHHENVLMHGSAMIKMDAIKIVGGYDESGRLKGREDWGLWLKMLRAGYKFYKINERLCIYSLGTSVER